ncbi:MAG: NgoFVII family restriction endonuclease [Lachnospiraceae bacterium]|nr:NgoFVII family restriction endonuclease [Lachnospiraceae bacterium]
MKLLYSNILPLGTREGQETIIDCINEQIEMADRVEIAVGYISLASLSELDQLVSENSIGRICLTIGMYYIEGMPENSYHTAVKLNQKWSETGIGEIRIVKTFKYHGKLYCFYKNGKPFSAVIGSANLGVIKPEASNRRQYEVSALVTDENEVAEIAAHIEDLKAPNCSDNIANIKNMPLVREKNTALDGIDLVTAVPQSNINFYARCQAYMSFLLKLKVPSSDERHIDDGKHYTKSNINVCYAAPRSKRKARDWYETQLTVGADVFCRIA